MAIIGRVYPADIVIPAQEVSARHAEIRRLEGEYYVLTDLGSTNGTTVNGQSVSSATIRLTDQVRFGNVMVDLAAYRPIIDTPQSPPPPQPSPAPVVPQPPPPPPPSPAPVAPQPPPHAGVSQPGMGTELAVALAAQKSFGSKAFLCWVMYWFFWLPGFIMNIVYLNEAKQVEQLTGSKPPGKGCLSLLLFVYVTVPLILLVLILATGGAVLQSIL